MLKTKIKRLLDNIDKIPQEFFAETSGGKYKVIWFLNRQKPSVEASYDFDEERFGMTVKGEIIYGFDSGCSCPSPWSQADFGDENYVVREYKEFFFGELENNKKYERTRESRDWDNNWFDAGWEGEAEQRLDDILLFLEEDISVDRLLQIQNSELRRAIMKRVGYEKVKSVATVIHKDEFGELIRIGEDQYVKVDDSSTDREYLLYVDDQVKTAKEAVAWTFYLKGEDYDPVKQT